VAYKNFGGSKKGNVNFRVDITDLGKIDKFLKEIKKAGIRAMHAELKSISDDIIKKAVAAAPEKTGALKASGRTIKPSKAARIDKFVYTAIFGGVTRKGKFVDYALIVETRHPTKSNYLANAVAEVIPRMGSRVSSAVASYVSKVKG